MRRSHVTSLAVLLLGTLIGALAWLRFGQRTGPLESLTKEELYRRAQERDIPASKLLMPLSFAGSPEERLERVTATIEALAPRS